MLEGAWRSIAAAYGFSPTKKQRLFNQLLRPGDLCFAIGAGEGANVRALLEAECRVVAIESDPGRFRTLEKAFGYEDNIILVHGTVGAKEEVRSRLMMTLDQLIDQHGIPQFCTISTETMTPEVLAGLTEPLPCLAFNFKPINAPLAISALERLETLGFYCYNRLLERASTWESHDWVDCRTIRDKLKKGAPGEIYARLLRAYY